MDSSKIKKVGTREEVFKGLAIRTAGGLNKNDIIEKQFGTRTMYISKRLSDKMRENFNIIRNNNPNHLRRQPKRTMTVRNQSEPATNTTQNTPTQTPNQTLTQTPNQSAIKRNPNNNSNSNVCVGGKTHKLSFKVKENTVKNVYYPELQGMNIQELKEELAREEAEEDRGLILANTPPKKISISSSSALSKPLNIEEMPDIDISNIDY